MDIKAFFEKNKDVSVLIARIIVGGIFFASGWMKVADMGMTLGFFSQMGIPAFLVYVVAYGELIAGALVILGLWFEYALIFSKIVMIVAVYFTYSMGIQAFGLPLAMLGAFCALAAAGTGKYAVKLPTKSN